MKLTPTATNISPVKHVLIMPTIGLHVYKDKGTYNMILLRHIFLFTCHSVRFYLFQAYLQISAKHRIVSVIV